MVIRGRRVDSDSREDPLRVALRRSLAIGSLLAALASARAARAVPFHYDAPGSCPALGEMAKAIEARRIRRDTVAASGVTLSVLIRQLKTRFYGRLEVRGADATRVREVDGDRCPEVSNALALAAALALDQYEQERQQKESESVRVGEPPANEGKKAPSLAKPPVIDEPEGAATQPGEASRFAVYSGVRLEAGLVPSTAWGASLGLGWRPPLLENFSIVLSAVALPEATFSVNGRNASYATYGAEVDGCFDIAWKSWLWSLPCLRVSAGIQLARGEGEVENFSRSVPWIALGLAPRARWGRPFFVWTEGHVAVPLVRRDFIFDVPRTVHHTTWPVTVGATLGIGLEL